MPKTTKDTINNIVWKACDTFRGTLDGTQYKDYVLTMLFVKYLADFYREKLASLQTKYNNNQDRITKTIKLEKFILDEQCTFEYLLTQKESSELGQAINMLASLNEQGTMGVVLPHGVLFRGASEGKIRQQILDNNLLDCVIGLPANLFFGVSIPATILIFKKNKQNTDVLFIDASGEFIKHKNQNNLEVTHIDKILSTYKNRKTQDKYSHLATLKEIQENDYNLNIPRYVDTFEEETPVDIAKTKQEINTIETQLVGIKKQMDDYLQALGL